MLAGVGAISSPRNHPYTQSTVHTSRSFKTEVNACTRHMHLHISILVDSAVVTFFVKLSCGSLFEVEVVRAGLVALQLCGVLNLACLQVGLIGLEAHHVPIAVPGCLSLAMWLYYVMLAGPSANVHPTLLFTTSSSSCDVIVSVHFTVTCSLPSIHPSTCPVSPALLGPASSTPHCSPHPAVPPLL